MSGHSHAKTVMRTKQASDAKRSQVFSKLAKELQVAAKEGGADPVANPRIRSVIEKAKEANMPTENVERALKKIAAGEGGDLEEILIEAYGPGNAALLISAITDNHKRTIGAIKQILQKNQGKMVEGGAVRWLFEKRGIATLDPVPTPPNPSKEELELLCIEAGAEDLYWRDQALDIYAAPNKLSYLKEELESRGFEPTTSLGWVPKERITIPESDQQNLGKLLETLDEQDDVQGVYSNI